MKITIDEAIKYLRALKRCETCEAGDIGTCKSCSCYRIGSSAKCYDAIDVGIEIMRKYKKIQEIYERFQKDGDYYHHMAWLDVVEVLEDGNVD
jgi:hypothetical protein